MRVGRSVLWDVWCRGTFSDGTFSDGTFLEWDVFRVGRFKSWTFCMCTWTNTVKATGIDTREATGIDTEIATWIDRDSNRNSTV